MLSEILTQLSSLPSCPGVFVLSDRSLIDSLAVNADSFFSFVSLYLSLTFDFRLSGFVKYGSSVSNLAGHTDTLHIQICVCMHAYFRTRISPSVFLQSYHKSEKFSILQDIDGLVRAETKPRGPNALSSQKRFMAIINVSYIYAQST